jgi:sigma-B regulation protein RsbU (phosphoserine phosphatase)
MMRAAATMDIATTGEARRGREGVGFLQGDWRERLALIDATMRELSQQDDPQAMVRSYGSRVRKLMPAGRWLSMSRRELKAPWYRITRSSTWTEEIDPWRQTGRLPLLEGGLLGDLLYGDEPRLIDDIGPLLAEDDPAFAYLDGFRSLMAIPHYDQGVAINMVILLEREPAAFDPEKFPEWLWVSSLFGRLTHNLRLRDELRGAYDHLEREMRVVADIQRSLLPQTLPTIPRLELGAHYQTSRWAGGDYYDFFPLPDGRWGILIADVSGHGTPAAVMMAITHSLAHGLPGNPEPPGLLLGHVNRQLCQRYSSGSNEGFVTAFYGIFDPAALTLSYASAGHNPPRLRRCGSPTVTALEEVGGPPLGLFDATEYDQTTLSLQTDDTLAFYTDGITEAMDARGTQFGTERLDEILGRCDLDAPGIVRAVIDAVDAFTGGQPPEDDRTLLVAVVG